MEVQTFMTGWVTDACLCVALGDVSLYCRLGWMVMETDRVTVEVVLALAVTK